MGAGLEEQGPTQPLGGRYFHALERLAIRLSGAPRRQAGRGERGVEQQMKDVGPESAPEPRHAYRVRLLYELEAVERSAPRVAPGQDLAGAGAFESQIVDHPIRLLPGQDDLGAGL